VKIKIKIGILLSIFFFSCNSGYEQNIQRMYSQKFCLDINATKKRNEINIGKGTLLLKKDMTFIIENDTLKYSNIKGEWDLCCRGSDWGNYVFKPENHIRQMTSSPVMEVKIEKNTYYLVFTSCE
jgi:hypothetical protein